MNIYIKIALIFFLFSFSAKAEIIKKIEINGNQRVSSETIKIFTEVEINKDLSLNNLNNVIKKIYSTNFFKNVYLIANIINTKTCVSAYKKKQEFTGAILKIINSHCKNYNKKKDMDENSKIIFVKDS